MNMEDNNNETIGVRLVKEVMSSIEAQVKPGEYELRADTKKIINSVKVLSFRSYIGKTWKYVYKMFGKEKRILANDVVLRKVSVYGKDYETVEYSDGRIMTLPNRKKYSKWSEFLSNEIDRLAVKHQAIPMGITRKGVIAGKPQLEN